MKFSLSRSAEFTPRASSVNGANVRFAGDVRRVARVDWDARLDNRASDTFRASRVTPSKSHPERMSIMSDRWITRMATDTA